MAILDKLTPSYNLEEFKNSNFYITGSAFAGAAQLGFDRIGIKEVVSTIKKEHFYKSMTSIKNHRIWQDVYHVPYDDFVIYIKFTSEVISEFTLLSFKEK